MGRPANPVQVLIASKWVQLTLNSLQLFSQILGGIDTTEADNHGLTVSSHQTANLDSRIQIN